jgi:hypothetical protein
VSYADHYHGEYASDRHDHHGDYADQRHDHDNEYAEKHHRHYDDESTVRGLRQDLGAAEESIRALEDDLRGALAFIRVLDRLRPTCVICLDATADRQTVRGPACTDCVGDLPDDGTGADPDRTETWAFAEPAAAGGAGRDTAVPGTRSLATLITDAAAQECTYCHADLGVPCVIGPDGWHLARFLGVMLSPPRRALSGRRLPRTGTWAASSGTPRRR